jgi:hypothetical protein
MQAKINILQSPSILLNPLGVGLTEQALSRYEWVRILTVPLYFSLGQSVYWIWLLVLVPTL